MRLLEMTSKDFEDLDMDLSLFVLPVGIVEAHGPHLPLGTDTFQAEALVDSLICAIPGIVAMPTLHYGQTSSTRLFPGSVTVPATPLESMVTAILEDLGRNGVRNIAIISGHAGGRHMEGLRDAAKTFLQTHPEAIVVVLSDYELSHLYRDGDSEDDRLKLSDMPMRDGHGGMVETSRMMVIRPDLVHPEVFEDREAKMPKHRVLVDHRPYWDGYAGPVTMSSEDAGVILQRRSHEAVMAVLGENFPFITQRPGKEGCQ